MVLYSTSMGIVRETYAKCANVKQILRTLLVKFEERDIFMSSEYQQEIKERMQSMKIQVPQLFVDGQHIGVSKIRNYLFCFFLFLGCFLIYLCEFWRHAVNELLALFVWHMNGFDWQLTVQSPIKDEFWQSENFEKKKSRNSLPSVLISNFDIVREMLM